MFGRVNEFSSILINQAINSKKKLILILILSILDGALIVFIGKLIGILIPQIYLKEYSGITLSCLFLLIIIRISFKYLLDFHSSYECKSITLNIRKILFNKILKSHIIQIEEINDGEIVELIVNKVHLVQKHAIFGSINFVKDFVTILFIFISIFIISWKVLGLVLISFTFLYFVNILLYRKIKLTSSKILKNQVVITELLLESVKGFIDIKNYRLEGKFEDEFQECFKNQIECYSSNCKFGSYSNLLTNVITYLFGGLTIFYILVSNLSITEFTTIITLLVFLQAPVVQINKFLSEFSAIIPSLKLLDNLVMNLNTNESTNNFVRTPNEDLNLKVEGLSFSYGKENIFGQLNLDFPPGMYILTGLIGSGKSTLAKLICGLLTPDEGKIKYSFQKSLNTILVLQEPIIFNSNLTDNICLTNYREVEYTKFKSKFSYFFELINKGDEILGDNLSGGQKQIISILRAIYWNPEVLIIDEISNNLPAEISDKLLKEIILTREEKITILISHEKLHIKLGKLIRL